MQIITDVARQDFNPRSPCGERRKRFWFRSCTLSFQSSLPVRGATQPRMNAALPSSISILAPRAGSDHLCTQRCTRHELYFNPRSPCGERQGGLNHSALYDHISILAPRAGSDRIAERQHLRARVFQSSLPVRGATVCVGTGRHCTNHFNPRSPCGERLADVEQIETELRISILAPRAGSDYASAQAQPYRDISILAPRAGSD